MVVSIISLGLLTWTFYLTRKSTQAAIEAAEAAKRSHNADRAWLLLSKKEVLFEPVQQWRDDVITDVFDLVFTIKNAGVTPALQVEVSIAQTVQLRSVEPPTVIEPTQAPAIIPLLESGEFRDFKPSFYETDGARINGGDWIGYIHLVVRYRDVFSAEPTGIFSTMLTVEYVYDEDVHYPSVWERGVAVIR